MRTDGDITAHSAPATGARVPYGVVDELRGTGPWVRFLAVVGFIVAAVVGIVAGFVLVASLRGGTGPLELASILVAGAIALLPLLPALSLWRYGAAITRLTRGGGSAALEEALAQQRRFWQFAGWATIVSVLLYGAAFALAVVSQGGGTFG